MESRETWRKPEKHFKGNHGRSAASPSFHCSYSEHIWSIKISDSELYLFFFLSVFHQTSHKLWLLNDRVTTLMQSIHPSLFNSCPPPFIYIPSCSGFTAVYLSRSRCLPKNPWGFLLHMKLVYHSHIAALSTICVWLLPVVCAGETGERWISDIQSLQQPVL